MVLSQLCIIAALVFVFFLSWAAGVGAIIAYLYLALMCSILIRWAWKGQFWLPRRWRIVAILAVAVGVAGGAVLTIVAYESSWKYRTAAITSLLTGTYALLCVAVGIWTFSYFKGERSTHKDVVYASTV